ASVLLPPAVPPVAPPVLPPELPPVAPPAAPPAPAEPPLAVDPLVVAAGVGDESLQAMMKRAPKASTALGINVECRMGISSEVEPICSPKCRERADPITNSFGME